MCGKKWMLQPVRRCKTGCMLVPLAAAFFVSRNLKNEQVFDKRIF